MKNKDLLLLVFGIITLLYACKKDSTGAPITIFSTKFDNQANLNAWTQSVGGKAIIDANAVKFDSITDCFRFETLNLIPVQKGKIYELKLTGKVNSSTSGDPGLCAGDFLIYVVQGSTNLISESFGQYASWTQKSYSFEATSSASIKIKFLIGTTRGAWIDNLELIEK